MYIYMYIYTNTHTHTDSCPYHFCPRDSDPEAEGGGPPKSVFLKIHRGLNKLGEQISNPSCLLCRWENRDQEKKQRHSSGQP